MATRDRTIDFLKERNNFAASRNIPLSSNGSTSNSINNKNGSSFVDQYQGLKVRINLFSVKLNLLKERYAKIKLVHFDGENARLVRIDSAQSLGSECTSNISFFAREIQSLLHVHRESNMAIAAFKLLQREVLDLAKCVRDIQSDGDEWMTRQYSTDPENVVVFDVLQHHNFEQVVHHTPVIIEEPLVRDIQINNAAKQTQDLARIMEQLNREILSQGETLDRIDCNIEQVSSRTTCGTQEIVASEAIHRDGFFVSRRKQCLCIVLLALICLILVITISLK